MAGLADPAAMPSRADLGALAAEVLAAAAATPARSGTPWSEADDVAGHAAAGLNSGTPSMDAVLAEHTPTGDGRTCRACGWLYAAGESAWCPPALAALWAPERWAAEAQPCGIAATPSGLYAWRCTTDRSNCVAGGTGGIGEVAAAAAEHAATAHSGQLDTDLSVTDDPVHNALDRIEVAVELLAEQVQDVAGEVEQVAHYQRVTRVAAPRRPSWLTSFAWHLLRTLAGVLVLAFLGAELLPWVDVFSPRQALAAGVGVAAVAYLTLMEAAAAAEVAEAKYRQARRRAHDRSRRSASELDPWERQVVSAFAAAGERNATSRIDGI